MKKPHRLVKGPPAGATIYPTADEQLRFALGLPPARKPETVFGYARDFRDWLDEVAGRWPYSLLKLAPRRKST